VRECNTGPESNSAIIDKLINALCARSAIHSGPDGKAVSIVFASQARATMMVVQ